MQIREGTLDQYVINEQSGYKSLFVQPHKKGPVLDIGANIGAFSAHWSKKHPDLQFIGYEPEQENYDMAVANNSHLSNVTMYRGAIMKDDGTLTLYVNDKKNKGTHTTIPTRGRSTQTVPGIAFEKVLDKYKPEILKIDIEGGEYDLLDTLFNLPGYVRSIAIELHLTKRTLRHHGWELYDSLKEQFPVITKDPKLDEKPMETYKAWAVVFIGHRE